MTEQATRPQGGQETTVRPHRSVSQVNAMTYCAEQYRLTRVLGVPERPSVWSAGGRAFHKATEVLDLTPGALDECADPDQWEPWLNVFDETFESELALMRLVEPDERKWRTAGRRTKDKPEGESVSWWRSAGRGFVANYIRWRLATADSLVVATVKGCAGVEVEVKGHFADVPFLGYVDRLMQYTKTQQYVVVDLKTGSRTPDSPLQLAAYSLLLEPLVDAPVTWGQYFDARKGELLQPIDLSMFTPYNLGRLFTATDDQINAGIFPPNVGSHCVSCGVKPHCIYQGGIEPRLSAPEVSA